MRKTEDAPLHVYTPDLFNTRSAEVVVPLLLDMLGDAATVRSVVDVGCGLGTWLSVFGQHGATELLGLDGAHVDPGQLAIPRSCFTACDLTQPPDLGRRFDLALCLEVGEHLPPGSADGLVDYLAGLADIVLFSAGAPGQGGQHHLNEQWPEYWAGKFAERGLRCHDTIRHRIWENPEVEWWYRQNLLLFLRPDIAPHLSGSHPLPLIHPDLFGRTHAKYRKEIRKKGGVRGIAREIGSIFRRLFGSR